MADILNNMIPVKRAGRQTVLFSNPPAIISSGPSVWNTASRWRSFNLGNRESIYSLRRARNFSFKSKIISLLSNEL